MSTLSEVAVVIPTCNRPQLLRQCLESVERSLSRVPPGSVEVIVSDDSVDTASRDVVGSFPWARWVQGPRRGPASNRNAGVAAAQAPWILFTDDDCLVEEHWVDTYMVAIRRYGQHRVFEGKTVADRHRLRMDEESPVNLTGGYLWSCNMAIQRATFDRIGGFCETFPYAAMEDVDLRLRLRAENVVARFLPDAVVCHPFRTLKGLNFAVKRGISYIHLVERHPSLLGKSPWTSMLMLTLRSSWHLARDAVHCRCRGISAAFAQMCVILYYDFRARWRVVSSRQIQG